MDNPSTELLVSFAHQSFDINGCPQTSPEPSNKLADMDLTQEGSSGGSKRLVTWRLEIGMMLVLEQDDSVSMPQVYLRCHGAYFWVLSRCL